MRLRHSSESAHPIRATLPFSCLARPAAEPSEAGRNDSIDAADRRVPTTAGPLAARLNPCMRGPDSSSRKGYLDPPPGLAPFRGSGWRCRPVLAAPGRDTLGLAQMLGIRWQSV